MMAIRTRVIDDLIREAVADGIDLVLNLGAGLDIRTGRRSRDAKNCSIRNSFQFEVSTVLPVAQPTLSIGISVLGIFPGREKLLDSE